MWEPSADREGWVRMVVLSVATVIFAAAALVVLGRPADVVAHRSLVAAALLVAGGGLLYGLSTDAFLRHLPLALLSVATVIFGAAAYEWLRHPSDFVARWAVVPAALLIVASGLLQAISTGGLFGPSPLHRPLWFHRHAHRAPRRR